MLFWQILIPIGKSFSLTVHSSSRPKFCLTVFTAFWRCGTSKRPLAILQVEFCCEILKSLNPWFWAENWLHLYTLFMRLLILTYQGWDLQVFLMKRFSSQNYILFSLYLKRDFPYLRTFISVSFCCLNKTFSLHRLSICWSFSAFYKWMMVSTKYKIYTNWPCFSDAPPPFQASPFFSAALSALSPLPPGCHKLPREMKLNEKEDNFLIPPCLIQDHLLHQLEGCQGRGRSSMLGLT